MKRREVLAIIPARGGSKGIPRKNLVDIAGVPMVAHSIRHALAARHVTRVVVSTDDEEIARVALQHGAEVPFMRPSDLAQDHVLDLPVFAHVLHGLEELGGYVPELVVHLRPTAPYRQDGWVDEATERLAAHPEADSVRSVSVPREHPYRVFRVNAEGYLAAVMAHEHPSPALLRRQDQPAMYHYNCVVDVTRPRTILGQQSMTGARMLPLILPRDHVFDVDTPLDLRITRAFMEGRL